MANIVVEQIQRDLLPVGVEARYIAWSEDGGVLKEDLHRAAFDAATGIHGGEALMESREFADVNMVELEVFA